MSGNFEDKIYEAIKDENFSVLEWGGFKANPTLALVAGIAIGYKMCAEDTRSKLGKVLRCFDSKEEV